MHRAGSVRPAVLWQQEQQLVSHLPIDLWTGEHDVGMLLLPMGLNEVPTILKYWLSHNMPPMKVVSERPNFFQLFHQPMAIFLQLPAGTAPREFKLAICNAVHSQEAVIPFPTTQNCWNGMCIARKTLKVHWSMAARALPPLAGLQTRLCSLAFPARGSFSCCRLGMAGQGP